MAVKKRTEPAAPRNLLTRRILAQRAEADAEISLERLEAALVDTRRYDVVAALKELEKAGHGRFIAGRKGQRSRFVWGGQTARARGRTAAQPEAKALEARTSPEPSKAGSKKSELAARAPDQPEPKVTAPGAPTQAGLRGGLARHQALVPAGRRLERTKLSGGGVVPVSRVARSLQHSFHLRPGAMVTIELPEDVTPAEVERFCNFLKTLPFAGPRR